MQQCFELGECFPPSDADVSSKAQSETVCKKLVLHCPYKHAEAMSAELAISELPKYTINYACDPTEKGKAAESWRME